MVVSNFGVYTLFADYFAVEYFEDAVRVILVVDIVRHHHQRYLGLDV